MSGDHSAQRTELRSLDLAGLFGILWERKWILVFVALIVAAGSIAFAFSLPNVYRAEATLIPNNEQGSAGFGGLAGQYGGLAGLAGIDLGSGDGDRKRIGLAVLRSRQFISDFVQEHDILISLMASDGWDAHLDQVVIDEDDYDVASGEWVRKPNPPRGAVPSQQEAYERFLEILRIDENQATGLIKVSIDHHSPTLAKRWVDWLIEDINTETRQREIAKSTRAIEFLTAQANEATVASLRASLFRLIEDQIKIIALAEATPEFLFRVIDPAVVPEIRVSPKRKIIVLGGGLLGGLLGALLAIVMYLIRLPRSVGNGRE